MADGDIDDYSRHVSQDLHEESEDIEAKDQTDIELDRIRNRRENPGNRFLVNTIVPQTFDDATLVFGAVSGLVFFGLITLASSGLIIGDSIVVDETLSGTPLDTSDCVDRRGEVWIQTWVNHDQELKIISHNIPDDSPAALFVGYQNESASENTFLLLSGGMGDISEILDGDNFVEGEYHISVTLVISSNKSNDWQSLTQDELENIYIGKNELGQIVTKDLRIEIKTVKSSSLFGSGEPHTKMEKIDEEMRTCMTIQDFGAWGWVLMGAEWVGGRETAMLTGGSAEVPPWYMAIVSLGMSVFFLCVQYPLMHRLYHREADDLLSSKQMTRLIERTIEKSCENIHVIPDLDQMKVQDRAISVDVYLPYRITKRTIVPPIEVKGTLIKHILNEFRIFGEMRPLQIKTVRLESDSSEEENAESSIEHKMDESSIQLSEDYSEFFSNIGQFGMLEERFRESMARWFRKHDVADYGSAIMADEDTVFVRVISRPVMRFAYFLFKPTYEHLQGELRDHLSAELKDLLDDRILVVSARNEKSTLGDRAVAGRVEQGGSESQWQLPTIKKQEQREDLSGEAMVARRGGIPGALLQNPFMGDILSSVEYVAHKNRSRIDRYGFWGLIVFVWIPFMASGVLVGAMLGLVARMRFERVLAACFIGGTAASITWAYTARGIIEVMERYHAEALIPFIILLAIIFTWLKIRDNKRHRREELFRDSMAFFAGASET
ncbi:MAG: hypothetical protein CMB61_04745 [Euryarchaeota archaeon]|nr:hypothetical protein [Euryarchaeota archaeon]